MNQCEYCGYEQPSDGHPKGCPGAITTTDGVLAYRQGQSDKNAGRVANSNNPSYLVGYGTAGARMP